jgi:hypothetical protein
MAIGATEMEEKRSHGGGIVVAKSKEYPRRHTHFSHASRKGHGGKTGLRCKGEDHVNRDALCPKTVREFKLIPKVRQRTLRIQRRKIVTASPSSRCNSKFQVIRTDTMATTKVTTVKSQNATSTDAFDKAVKAIKDANTASIRWEDAKRQAVRAVNSYRDSLPRNERKAGVEAICKKAEIDRATYFRWQAELQENEELGEEILQEAAKENIVINTPLRSELLEVKRERPHDPARTILSAAVAQCKIRKEKQQPESAHSKACKAIREYLNESGGKEKWSAEIARLAREVYPDYNPCGGGA